MSIFSKIKDAIFGGVAHAAPVSPASTSPASAPSSHEPAVTRTPPIGGTGQAVPPTAGASVTQPSAPSTTASRSVDIVPVLDAAVARSGQKLDWKHSIVDLMKALGMDASLAERKELAEELGYTGELTGSAEMNTWLHKALLRKLSENGGEVPADLLD